MTHVTNFQSTVGCLRFTMDMHFWNWPRPHHTSPSSGVFGKSLTNHLGGESSLPLREKKLAPLQ